MSLLPTYKNAFYENATLTCKESSFKEMMKSNQHLCKQYSYYQIMHFKTLLQYHSDENSRRTDSVWQNIAQVYSTVP